MVIYWRKEVLLPLRPKWPPEYPPFHRPGLVGYSMQPRYSNLWSQFCYLSSQEQIKTKMFFENIFLLLCIGSTTIITGNSLLLPLLKVKYFVACLVQFFFQRNKNSRCVHWSQFHFKTSLKMSQLTLTFKMPDLLSLLAVYFSK